MSDIWKLIKEGKEKLNIKKKEGDEMEDDEDMLMFEQEKKEMAKNNNTKINANTEEENILPEWLTQSDICEIRKLKDYPVFELHEEIIRLEKWLQPTAFDKYLRECIVDDLKEAFTKADFPAEVYPFGSFLTNLCLPNSDLDVMIDCNLLGDSFKKIEKIIRKSGFATNVIAITHARVPIIKFKHMKTGIDVDISINQDSSLLTSAYVIRQLERYPLLRVMVHVIKYLLTQREMNETFHGGVGSFMVTLLCIGCEQWCIREGTEKGNLGNRLLQFFYYYGFVFNYEKLVLRVRGDGGFVTKEEKDWFDEAKDYYLSVENPIDTSLDVGKSSYNIKRFKSFCSHALCKLTYNLNEYKTINNNPRGYFLKGIIRVDHRYCDSILNSDYYKQWGQPGMVLPDSEKRRLALIDHHMEAVKKCDKKDLQHVYEGDYNAFMNISTSKPRFKKEPKRFSQKRNGGGIGSNKKYRRF